MAESSQHSLPQPPDGALGAPGSRSDTAPRRALLVTLVIAVGGALLGIVGGLVWSVIAPQALFVVASHGIAYVVNPETSAFIAADGWYSVVAVGGGLIIGLAGYLFGVRRFGPLPVAGVLAGATAAAFLAWWIGRNMGLSAFRHQLGTSKPGTLLRQPANLGAHGALAFWPLAAGAVIAGIELVIVLRERQRRTLAERSAARHARTGRPEPAPLEQSPHAGLHQQADGYPDFGQTAPYYLDGQAPGNGQAPGDGQASGNGQAADQRQPDRDLDTYDS